MREPYTSADLDAIEELQRSPGHILVEERIAAQLERKRAELEGPWDEPKTAAIRGAIDALRTVLRIPGILKIEIKGSLEEQP